MAVRVAHEVLTLALGGVTIESARLADGTFRSAALSVVAGRPFQALRGRGAAARAARSVIAALGSTGQRSFARKSKGCAGHGRNIRTVALFGVFSHAVATTGYVTVRTRTRARSPATRGAGLRGRVVKRLENGRIAATERPDPAREERRPAYFHSHPATVAESTIVGRPADAFSTPKKRTDG